MSPSTRALLSEFVLVAWDKMDGFQRFWRIAAIVAVGMLEANSLLAQDIPAELMEDPHFREEFGINDVTTPSIRKVFDQLNGLGKLPWARYGRELPEGQPAERFRLALALGGLIAEGFFVTQAEDVAKLEAVGAAIIRQASALGAGPALGSHLKALTDYSQRGDWDGLREELAKAQQRVEVELIRLRDVEAVQLISFGGWLRALEVVCAAALDPYSPGKGDVLRRLDVVTYYSEEMETLHPQTLEEPRIIALRAGLERLRPLLEQDRDKPVAEQRLGQIREVVAGMAKSAFGG